MNTLERGQHTGAPASIIQYKDEELREYAQRVAAYRRGEISEGDFRFYRLRLGVYGQRQPDVQMMRVKIPGGLLHADQLDALGQVAEQIAPMGKGHLTTRENMQFHHTTLEAAASAMHILHRVGLSSREACGNTVRNVVACPMVGLDPRQAFDILPYLGAFVRSFVRRDFTHNMPRKIKPAFSCGEHDCAVTPMHDLGFIATVREEGGSLRKGFKMVVGGGTSIQPLMAQSLYEFVPVEEFIRVSEAVLRVFNATGWLRRNIMKARIKVLVHAEGVDSLRRKVEEELQQDWARDYPDIATLLFADDEQADAPPLPSGGGHPDGQGDAGFDIWKATNTTPQQQDGYALASVTVPRGDLTAGQLHGLAAIARSLSSRRAHTTPEQNLMFRWVPRARLYEMYQALGKLGLAEAGVNQVTDVTSCPGTDSCKLGITSAMGLNRAIGAALASSNGLLDDPLVRQVHVKASGCPNGCGRHHVADIGFQGAVMKGPGGAQVPSYEVFLGGGYEEADVRYGLRTRAKVPAKRAPQAVLRFLGLYREQRQEGEAFRDFVARVGTEPFDRIVAEMARVGPLGRETIDLYMDHERSVLYKLERGEGECAA